MSPGLREHAHVCSRVMRDGAPRKRAPDVEPAVKLALLLPGHFSPRADKPVGDVEFFAEEHPTSRRDVEFPRVKFAS